MLGSRNTSRIAPSDAIAAATANANSFAVGTLMPSAAAARSLALTAISRRPLRPRRMFETINTQSTNNPSTSSA
jgi:hypothetical protein